MAAKRVAFILGDQLFPLSQLRPLKGTPVFMSEDWELCSRFSFHKHKLIFFLSAMRTYADDLAERGWSVHYAALEDIEKKERYEKRLLEFIESEGASEVISFEIADQFLSRRMQMLFDKRGITWTQVPSPAFLCPAQEFEDYLSTQKKPFMKTFYERERKRLGVLLNKDGSPKGGKWSFDGENRKKLPKDVEPPALPSYGPSETEREVSELVEKNFAKHPGSASEYWLSATRAAAKKRLTSFLKERLQSFGDYQDALTTQSDFVFHSILSPYINCGLLTPREVLDAALKYADQNAVPLNALEGFVRQLMGWREFVRGIYLHYESDMTEANFFGHQRELGKAWYTGETGVLPLDLAIKKTLRYGYAHHIERLMVLANLMTLCEIHPQAAYRWFMEMYIDSADWVMAANVYDMGIFSSGGIFATKPYICGSNYLLKMSDYKKGEWCDTIDGLYWSFIERNREYFSSQPRLSMMARTLDKMKPERRERIFAAADAFKEQHCPQ